MSGFTADLTQTIMARHSTRTFEPSVPEKEIATLTDFIGSLPRPPFGTPHRYAIVTAAGASATRVPGTYGVVRGASRFVCGSAANSPESLMDFAYLLELIVLKATELGLGTCWIGGTFNRSGFGARFGLADGEILPAICPLGYPAEKPSMGDRLGRLSAGSEKRKPFEELFFDGGFSSPMVAARAGRWRLPLEMVRLAPSAVNRQPWRVVRDGNALHFFCRPSGLIRGAFRDFDMHMLDMGIAMSHCALAAVQGGLKGRWTRMRHPELKGLKYIISFEA